MVKGFVYIPVSNAIRQRIIKKKGALTYDEYFDSIIGATK